MLRTRVPQPVEHRTLYEIQPFAPGNFATPWSSTSGAFGTLRGRFVVAGDVILSAYESATGRYRGQDTLVRRDERAYSSRGMLSDGARLVSVWTIELRRA